MTPEQTVECVKWIVGGICVMAVSWAISRMWIAEAREHYDYMKWLDRDKDVK